MKLLISMCCCLVLTGCVTTPVSREFPEIPPALQKSCPELNIVPVGTTKFSEVLTVVTENYAQYKECQARVDAWRQWYSEQRTVFESVR